MKKFIKKTLATVLALVMISGTFVCFAAELNSDAVAMHKGQYENYLLLGDSVASGYRDEMSDNDADFNEANNESTYWRVPGSYADVLANAIIDDKSMTAFAGPGFRTIEVRYMLEDEFAATCEDEYLFHPSHLYVYEDYGYLPGDERIRKAYQKAVADADLITLGVGGNDWGAYLGWVVTDVLEAEHVADRYIQRAEELLANSPMDISTVEKLVEIAHIAGALPALLQTVPSALNYGLSNFYKNWDIMIEDIYSYNPDVTLMVVGMSDNSIKGKHYDYNGVEGAPVNDHEAEQDQAKAQVMSLIVDFIMSVGNKPMIDGAEKFGYTYVDIDGATYVDSHPDADGHVFIANKIIEALPDPVISEKFTDITTGHKYYNAVEYVVSNGIMTGVTDDTFAPDEALTKGQLAAAFNAISGNDNATDSTEKVSALKLAISLISAGTKKGILGFFKSFSIATRVLADNNFNIIATVTRGEAAKYLQSFCEI